MMSKDGSERSSGRAYTAGIGTRIKPGIHQLRDSQQKPQINIKKPKLS